ncbi:hypothetical protein C2G38_765517 [Gigaspora rosea]|uniref:Uncharacterized protein n=1 Tax=Gigaspora rosea TaxID=44941 RepID=A0A397U8D6_9GLOM|nr:hypothetical protein C2G38_765517 [Gigaspora rosea]
MTYIMSINQRYPHKFMISRNTDNIWMTELLPGMLFISRKVILIEIIYLILNYT